MKRYLISFDAGAMDHVTGAELEAASVDSHAVVADAKQAGAWVFGGGMYGQRGDVVGTDGVVSDGPEPGTKPEVGGFAIVDVETREEALGWAARIAAACRCAQDVREIMWSPES